MEGGVQSYVKSDGVRRMGRRVRERMLTMGRRDCEGKGCEGLKCEGDGCEGEGESEMGRVKVMGWDEKEGEGVV